MYAGHISSVYRAVHRKSSITVGLKLYKRSALNDMERHQIAREIWLHIQLAHASIIALYAAWKDANYIYLVLEWAPEVGGAWTHAWVW
jgi:serine/threonine protein kinase